MVCFPIYKEFDEKYAVNRLLEKFSEPMAMYQISILYSLVETIFLKMRQQLRKVRQDRYYSEWH